MRKRIWLMFCVVFVVTFVLRFSFNLYEQERRATLGRENLKTAMRLVQSVGGSITEGNVNGDFYIDLMDSRITDAQLIQLAELMRAFPPPEIDKNRQLQFDASRTSISDVGVKSLKGLPLLTLTLDGTKVTDEGVKETLSPSLIQMWLDNTAVTDRLIDHFDRCPNLAIFSCQQTNITPAGMKRIPDYCKYFFNR